MIVWCVYCLQADMNQSFVVTKIIEPYGGSAQKSCGVNPSLSQPSDSSLLSSDYSRWITKVLTIQASTTHTHTPHTLLGVLLLYQYMVFTARHKPAVCKYTDVSYLLFIFGRFCSFPKDTVEVCFSTGGQVLS